MVMKCIRQQNGEGIVAFLALLPLFFIMILLVVQLMIIGYSKLFVQQAAYSAAKASAKNPEQIESKAIEVANKVGGSFLYQWSGRSSVTVEAEGDQPGDTVTVTINYNFPKLSGIATLFRIPPNMQVSARAISIVEEVP